LRSHDFVLLVRPSPQIKPPLERVSVLSIYAYTLLPTLELAGLFAVWNWARRRQTIVWLIFGCTALIIMSIVAALIDHASGAIWRVLASTYLWAGLAWAWRMEGLSPVTWQLGEWLVATLAAAVLCIAALST